MTTLRYNRPITFGTNKMTPQDRLEYLRGELHEGRISHGELAELQSLVKHIDPDDIELLEAAGAPEGAITAEVHADDFSYQVQFDALKWFQEATDDEILKLANCGWGGDYPADNVALATSAWDKEVAALFDYLERRDIGFECYVYEKPALKWLKQHRPHIFEKVSDE